MDALTIGLIVILVLAVLVFLASGLKLIGDYEVGILYKKMFGKKMPQGQGVARNGEVGVNGVKITPDILISAASGDQAATSLLLTWLAQAVAKGVIGSGPKKADEGSLTATQEK
ncbi:MAG: hypothetical protein LUO79_08935 [Methanomassiliicoccales archaeon]|nr:hypothetical protein [Methanomassiliicoccales archaeon]